MVKPAGRRTAPVAEVPVALDPPVPGVVLLYRADRVVYVQYAIDCRCLIAALAARRVYAFDRAAFIPCPPEDLAARAAAYVEKYRPEYNPTIPPPRVLLTQLLRARDLAREIIVSHGRQGVGWAELLVNVEGAMGGAAVDRLSLGKLLDLDPAVRWQPASLAYVAA